MRSVFARLLVASFVAASFAPSAVRAQDGEKPKEDKPKSDTPPAPPPPDGGQGRRGGGFMMRMIDGLKDQLGLSDEQMTKIREVVGSVDMREAFRKAREEAGDDQDKMREIMQKNTEKLQEQIKAVLNKDQAAKYDELVKGFQQGGFGRGMGGFGGGQGGGRGGWNPNSEERRKQLCDQAEKALVLGTEEKAAVMPLVKKLLDLKAEVAQRTQKRREEISALVKDDGGAKKEGETGPKSDVTAKLSEHKKASAEDKTKLDEAQAALRDLLTVDNEARLVALGILD